MITGTTTSGPAAATELACARARRVLADWRGRGRVAVFGAGAHTRKILPVLEAFESRIAGVADDSPGRWGQRVGRWTVRSPRELIDAGVGGILISSDVQQTPLAERVRHEFGERAAVLTLYPEDAAPGDGPALAFTGERQTGRTLEEIEIGHRARYYWALQHIERGAAVLDAACGNGYGSRILSDGGARVVGLDVAEDAIEFARHHFGGEQSAFEVCDLEDPADVWRCAARFTPLDAIVSLETIEHLRRPESFLRTACGLLERGGALLCSTPNAEAMTVDEAPFHRNHFSVEQVVAMLREAGFALVDWFGQEGMEILKTRVGVAQRYCLYHAVRVA